MRPSPSDTDWAYLAGVIDGEGSLRIRNPQKGRGSYPAPQLRIGQCHANSSIVHHLKEVFGVGLVREYSPRRQFRGSTGGVMWRIYAQDDVRWLLEGAMPYLVLKRKKAEEIVGALVTHKESRHVR